MTPASSTFRRIAAPSVRLGKRLAGREGWALADQAIVSGTNFLTNVILARFMGLSEFGVFVLAWMAVVFANSLQNALIVAPLVSIGPKQDPADRPRYFGAVVAGELILVATCFLLAYGGLRIGALHFPRIPLRLLALPLACSVAAYQMQDFVRRAFFASHQWRRALIDDAVSYLPQLPVLLFLGNRGLLTSPAALWVMASTSAAGAMLGWLWVEPFIFDRAWMVSVTRRHWRVSRWLTGSALLTWLSTNLFVLAAPATYGPTAAGALKAAQNLMGATHVWFQGLENVVPVETARRLHADGVKAMLGYTRATILKWSGLTLLFALVVSAAPSLWLRLAYGAQMALYGNVLRLYALLYVIVFIGGPLRAALQALEFTVPIFWSYLAMTGLAFVFALPMARQLGLAGTMLGLVAAQALFQSILGLALRHRTHEIDSKS